MHKKTDKSIFKNCISEKFRKQHNFFTCILPDYVFHESLKEFWKNNHFENMRAKVCPIENNTNLDSIFYL